MNQKTYPVFVVLCAALAAAIPACAQDKRPEEETGAKAYYNRGTEHYGKGDYEAAVKDLSAAIVLEPKAPDAFFNRGLSYRRQRKNDEALADFSKAIALYPNHAGYYFERCNVRIVQNDLVGAVSDCSAAIRLSPNEADGYFLRGVANFSKGDSEKALADGIRALQIQPDHADAVRLVYEALVQRETRMNGAPSFRAPDGKYGVFPDIDAGGIRAQ